MNNTVVPGEVGFHKTIGPSEIQQHGGIESINQMTAALRSELITMYASSSGKNVEFHLIASTAPLTDSAGRPLMTRGGG